jgi:hypothetical protein
LPELTPIERGRRALRSGMDVKIERHERGFCSAAFGHERARKSLRPSMRSTAASSSIRASSPSPESKDAYEDEAHRLWQKRTKVGGPVAEDAGEAAELDLQLPAIPTNRRRPR